MSRDRAAAWWRLVRFGFRLLYNEMAFTYDAVSYVVSLGEWRTWQRAALKHLDVPPGSRVLELAHGTANLQIDMHMQGLRPVGLDLSRYMGRIARRKLVRRGLPADLVRARAQALPFATGTFPAVVCTFPTEFIVHPDTLAEANRVLAPGGRLVFVVSGVLKGRGVASQGLELAYRVTGQRAGWPPGIEDRFQAAGFGLEVVAEACRRSEALVCIARKLPGGEV